MFVSQVEGAPLLGRPLALLTNCRLGLTGLPDTNTSFLQTFVNCRRKRFYNIWTCRPTTRSWTNRFDPRGLYCKTFYGRNCCRIEI